MASTTPRTLAAPLRTRAWWVMRQMKNWELSYLLSTVAEGTEADAADNLRQWLKALENVGIVARHQRVRLHPAEMRISRPCIYTLVRDVGPQPPIWKHRDRSVLDPNAGITHLIKPLGAAA